MDVSTILGLVKARLGINSVVRDTYLTAVIHSVLEELEDEQGIELYGENYCHIMFVVDYTAWRYQSRDNDTGMPRHLQFRLHNLIIHNRGDEV